MKHDGKGSSARRWAAGWQTAPRERVAASAGAARWWAGVWLVLWLAVAHLPALAQCPDCATPASPFVLNET